MQELLSRFSERLVWGVMQAACDHLGLPRPESTNSMSVRLEKVVKRTARILPLWGGPLKKKKCRSLTQNWRFTHNMKFPEYLRMLIWNFLEIFETSAKIIKMKHLEAGIPTFTKIEGCVETFAILNTCSLRIHTTRNHDKTGTAWLHRLYFLSNRPTLVKG